MKFNTAYYLLLLYIFAICKPVLPLLQDELAHLFWKAEHMATVHQHYGNHHTSHEIAAAHEEENDNEPAQRKTSEPVSIHLSCQLIYILTLPITNECRYSLADYHVSTVHVDKHYPPPKSC